MADEREWTKYEKDITKHLEALGGDGTTVEYNQSRPGRFSQTNRQIDALVTGGYGGQIQDGVTAFVDCKCYAKQVDVKDVESFIAMVDDVGMDLGFLITTVGFSPAAESRVKNGTRGLFLKTVSRVMLIDLNSPPYFPSHDEGYYEGAYFDFSPYGAEGATVYHRYVEESPYPIDPDEELEWMEEVLASGNDDQVNWGDDAAKADIARMVCRDWFRREPTEDEVQAFLDEFAGDWENGQQWVVYDGQISALF